MKTLINDFLIFLSSEKGLSSHTLDAYRQDLEGFSQFLNEASVMSWPEVDQQQIVDFIALKKSQNFAASSLCRYLVAIKVFFRFLKREGAISNNCALFIETPKMWQLIPEVLTKEEMEQILAQPHIETREGARDSAILEVLYASGLRVSELCQLKIQDVDDEFVKVHGKGGKERLVPIGKKAIEAIDRYLAFRDGDDNEALFITSGNRQMDRFTVWNLVKKYAKQAKLQKNISPHTFRHSFATHLLDNGADLRIIQELMGHADINSTDRYMHISNKQVQHAFHAFHPRDEG